MASGTKPGGESPLKSALIVVLYMSTWSFRNVFVQMTEKVHYSKFGNVLIQELCKLAAALFMYKGVAGHRLRDLFVISPQAVLPYVVPALLYAINNQLIFFAIEMIGATVYEISSNSKTILTALLAQAVLGTKLSSRKWIAIVFLMLGVLIPATAAGGGSASGGLGSSVTNTLLIILVMNLSTSSAGVYSNWLLSVHDETITFWHKSVYLYVFGALMNIIGGFASEGSSVLSQSAWEWLHVYTPAVWTIVFTNVLGGLLVGVLLKKLGVVTQNIAASSIMFATALLQWVVLYIPPTVETLLGAVICVGAVSVYNDDLWTLFLGLGEEGPEQDGPKFSPLPTSEEGSPLRGPNLGPSLGPTRHRSNTAEESRV